MFYDVDKEHHEIMKAVGDKVPVMTEKTPSQYSNDGKYLYLCSVDLKVGSEPEDYEGTVEVFEDIWSLRHAKLSGSLTDRLRKAANAARDQGLVAEWIRTHFIEAVSPELERRLDQEPKTDTPQGALA